MSHLETLKAYQAWRRGEDDRTMDEAGLTPKAIGEAIDFAITASDERDQLKAQVEHLREVLDDIYTQAQRYVEDYAKFNAHASNQALLKTPVQCLAEIKAQAGRDGYVKGANDWCAPEYENCRDLLSEADNYAQQLRQQAAKGGE